MWRHCGSVRCIQRFKIYSFMSFTVVDLAGKMLSAISTERPVSSSKHRCVSTSHLGSRDCGGRAHTLKRGLRTPIADAVGPRITPCEEHASHPPLHDEKRPFSLRRFGSAEVRCEASTRGCWGTVKLRREGVIVVAQNAALHVRNNKNFLFS